MTTQYVTRADMRKLGDARVCACTLDVIEDSKVQAKISGRLILDSIQIQGLV